MVAESINLTKAVEQRTHDLGVTRGSIFKQQGYKLVSGPVYSLDRWISLGSIKDN
jgi:hypothetical protein